MQLIILRLWSRKNGQKMMLTLGKTVTSINFVWRFASQGTFPISCYNVSQHI